MKKTVYLLSAAIAALCLISCQKEQAPETHEPLAENYVQWSFTANMEQTKTDLDGAHVVWDAGDVITLYYLDSENAPKSLEATTAEGGSNATFTADIPAGDNPDHFWAAYPAGSGTLTYEESAEKFTITVAKGDGSFKKANYMAAYSTAEAKSFVFKHAVGIIKLALPASGVISHSGTDYTIKTIRIKGKATSIYSLGEVEVNQSEGAVSGFADATTGTQSVPVDLTDEVRASGVAYFASLPGEFTSGFAVRYYSVDGNIPAVLTGNTAYALQRGHILPVVDASTHIQWDYYVAPDGTGNGKSEASPMSLSDFQTLITSGNENMASSNRLNGVTFHFADGTYALSSQITFPAFKEVTQIFLDGNGGAILDGQETVGILKFTGNNLLLKASGFTLQNGKANNGAGIHVAVGTVDDNKFIADFENCLIKDNIATASGGGGAILIATSVKNGQLRFNNCSFTGNKATHTSAGNGGVLYTANSTMAILFNKCSFKGNTGTSNGMQLYLNNAAARLGMNNCTINAGTSKLGNGSAITSKGYTVIANSTIWSSSSGMGNWGQIALGCATSNADPNGSKVVNSLIKNKNATYASFYLHGNYYQNIDYCLYTPVKEASTPTYGLTNSFEISDEDMGTKAESNSTVNGVTRIHYTFTKDYSSDMTFPTLAQVRESIQGVTGIGPLMLSWLDTIEGALSTDITGYERDPEASHPGSWQKR